MTFYCKNVRYFWALKFAIDARTLIPFDWIILASRNAASTCTVWLKFLLFSSTGGSRGKSIYGFAIIFGYSFFWESPRSQTGPRDFLFSTLLLYFFLISLEYMEVGVLTLTWGSRRGKATGIGWSYTGWLSVVGLFIVVWYIEDILGELGLLKSLPCSVLPPRPPLLGEWPWVLL